MLLFLHISTIAALVVHALPLLSWQLLGLQILKGTLY